MNRKEFEEKIIDYVDGMLSTEEQSEFEQFLEGDAEARSVLREYREVMKLESLIGAEKVPMAGDISNQVLDRIAADGAESGMGWSGRWRLFMEGVVGRRAAFGGLAGMLVLVLCLKLGIDTSPDAYQIKKDPEIGGQVSPEPIDQSLETKSGGPVTPGEISEARPPSPFNSLTSAIQPGNRALTIEADQTSGIEGYVQPGASVDVVATGRDANGNLTSRIISQNVKVLSSGQSSSVAGQAPKTAVSLLTSTEDALRIEVSKNQNEKISLQLRSGGDPTASNQSVRMNDLNVKRGAGSPSGSKPIGRVKVAGKEYEIGADGTTWEEFYSSEETSKLPGVKLSDRNTLKPMPDVVDRVNTDAFRREEEGVRIAIANSRRNSFNSLGTDLNSTDSSQYVGRIYDFNSWCSDGYSGKDYCVDSTGNLPQNTASFNSYEENQRITSSKEPMSTFSIDVDTASYSQARRALQEGRLPHQDSVRIEEFLNYFDYDYPVQTEKPFTLSYEAAPSPLDKSKVLLKLGIKAKESSPYEGGWNLVFLVDVSGSMSPEDRLPLVKKGLQILVDKMKPEDRVAIVTYAGASYVALESTPASEKEKILSAIASLSSGGGTNGSGGIMAAYRIAEKYKRKGAVNRVILATDGDFNVGVTSQGELIKMIEEKRRSGVTLTTIGVGTDNLKDGTLEQLADKGNGNYFYLDSLSEARKVMGEDLTKNVEVVAKDVKLQIEFNPEYVSSYRLVGYDNRKLANKDFNNDAIDAGEIGAGHTVTALYELVLTGSEAAQKEGVEYRYKPTATADATPAAPIKHSSELAFLKIRYKDPEASESKLLQYPVEASNVQKDNERSSDDFRFAAAVSYFGSILRGSAFAGSYSLADVAELANNARGKDERGNRREFVEMVKNAAVLKREQGISATRSWAE